MGYNYYGFDIYYLILVLPAFVFSLYAQFKVKSTFNQYSKVYNSRGMTGADVARAILNKSGLYDVRVEAYPGDLTDHYDPRTKVVRLSQSVYGSNSISAVGVAAHETGHAIQHKDGYAPLVLRSTLVPVANIGSSIGPTMAILGLVLSMPLFINLGIILFGVAVLFYLVTLPVEFNASYRAIRTLEDTSMLNGNEINPAKKVLRAAAMTYVASVAVAIASLLRLILLANRRDD
jgi:Zn-dependent membrane protease YugP